MRTSSIIAEGDYVIAHGRFTGMGRPAAWIAADVVRFEDGVLQRALGRFAGRGDQGRIMSGLPMFGDTFPNDSRKQRDRPEGVG